MTSLATYGPVLKSFSVENPCSNWQVGNFNFQGQFLVAVYVPPGTPAVTVSSDDLDAVGIKNLKFDGAGYGDHIPGGDPFICNRGLANALSFIVNADGTLQPITC